MKAWQISIKAHIVETSKNRTPPTLDKGFPVGDAEGIGLISWIPANRVA